jgi:disulfide bond formation protein DsbB
MSLSSSGLNYWRLLHGLGLLIALIMLGGALYLQITEFVLPCLLCVYLRVTTILYGITSLIAVLYLPQRWGRKMYLRLFLLYSLLGIVVSVYLLWIQMQPAAGGMSCGQGAGATLINWPFGETLTLLFSSYGDCVDVPWTGFGLTLPMLSLLSFIGLLVFELSKRRVLGKANKVNVF